MTEVKELAGAPPHPSSSASEAFTPSLPPLQAPAVDLRALSPVQNSHVPCAYACTHPALCWGKQAHIGEATDWGCHAGMQCFKHKHTDAQVSTLSTTLICPPRAYYWGLQLARVQEENLCGWAQMFTWVCSGVLPSPQNIPSGGWSAVEKRAASPEEVQKGIWFDLDEGGT